MVQQVILSQVSEQWQTALSMMALKMEPLVKKVTAGHSDKKI